MPSYDQQWIIRYVDGELSPEELGPFEAALQTDPTLATEVALYREVKAVLQERLPEDPVREAVTERTSLLNSQYFATRPRSEVSRPYPEVRSPDPEATRPFSAVPRRIAPVRWLTRIAAAACVLGAIALLWPRDNGKLDEIGKIEMVSTTERGSQTDELLQKAAVFFNKQAFEKALPLLNQAVSADTSIMLALFYRGIAAWHTNDLNLARTSLGQVYTSLSVLKYDAAFYMALSYAGEKNKALAREWLEKIPPADADRLNVKELEDQIK